jgi:dienelactone hydrolase
MRLLKVVYLKAFFLATFCFPWLLNAQELPQEILMVKKSGFFSFELETTVYKPSGDGPFPLVVINHGKAAGDPKFQNRSSYPLAARYFLARGYVVAIPMRQGFSKSTGTYVGGGCNVGSNGMVQADDVKATLDFFTAQPYIDKSRLVVAGQSHGGLTTMAFGTFNYPGVKGLINFAGGLRQEQCAGWESVLARAFGSYAKDTKIPSLWFYGDNDSYWPKPVWQSMYGRYSENIAANNVAARMVAFGTFVVDAHNMFGHNAGLSIWQPEVDKFLAEIGMPVQISLPHYELPKPTANK